MNKFIENKFKDRIKSGKCLICNKDMKEKVSINHSKFGNIEVCIEHMKDKIE